jgi:hypothetical protein
MNAQPVSTGLIYRNPKPHLYAKNAWHPTLIVADDELIATFDIGQAAESLDYRTYISRSHDEGQTWTSPVPLFPAELIELPDKETTHTARSCLMPNGGMVSIVGRFHRDNPEEGIINHENLGQVPTDLLLARSSDFGRTWSSVELIEAPLNGPGFEVAHPVMELTDGRWLSPLSTWRAWDGDAPNGMKAIALVSNDRGKTWPEYIDIMDSYAEGIVHWEQSVVQLSDSRLLAFAWAFDERSGQTKAVHFAISNDGKTFTNPRDTGLSAETTKLRVLKNGRIVAVYRGIDPPGLYVADVQIEGETLSCSEPVALWQGSTPSKMFGQAAAADELSDLKLGYPSITQLRGGDAMVAFWCYLDGIYNIRWVRFG